MPGHQTGVVFYLRHIITLQVREIIHVLDHSELLENFETDHPKPSGIAVMYFNRDPDLLFGKADRLKRLRTAFANNIPGE